MTAGLDLDFAYSLYELGRLDEAEICARDVLATDPHDAAALELLAAILERGRRFGELAEVGQLLTTVTPESARGPLFCSVALANQGDPAGAVRLARLAAGSAPDDTAVIGWLGQILLLTGAHDEAELVTRRALALEPEQAFLHALHARVLLAMGLLDEAHVAAATAVGIEPMDPDSLLQLSRVLLRQDRPHDGGAVLAALLRQAPSRENLDAVHQAITLEGGLRHELAMLETWVAEARAMLLPDPVERRERVGEARVRRAEVAQVAGRHGEALDMALDLLGHGFHELRLYRLAMHCAALTRRYSEGLSLARDAQAHYPEETVGLHQETQFLLMLGRAADAVDTATAYVALTSAKAADTCVSDESTASRRLQDTVLAYTMLSDALLRCDRLADAEHALLAAQRLDPGNTYVLDLLARLRERPLLEAHERARIATALAASDPDLRHDRMCDIRADTAHQMHLAGHYRQAFDTGMELLRQDFHAQRVYQTVLACAYSLGRHAEGLELARDAQSHHPEDTLGLYYQTQFLLLLGQTAEAVDAATTYLTHASTKIETSHAYRTLGDALDADGRHADAERARTEADRLDADNIVVDKWMPAAHG